MAFFMATDPGCKYGSSNDSLHNISDEFGAYNFSHGVFNTFVFIQTWFVVP